MHLTLPRVGVSKYIRSPSQSKPSEPGTQSRVRDFGRGKSSTFTLSRMETNAHLSVAGRPLRALFRVDFRPSQHRLADGNEFDLRAGQDVDQKHGPVRHGIDQLSLARTPKNDLSIHRHTLVRDGGPQGLFTAFGLSLLTGLEERRLTGAVRGLPRP